MEFEFQPLPGERHVVVSRGGFAAVVDRHKGEIGAPGLLIGRGLAMLVWRGGEPFFVAKSHEQPATADQVDALRRFRADLETALKASRPYTS